MTRRYKDLLAADTRRQILILLAEADNSPRAEADGGLSDGMLQTSLDMTGHRPSIEALHAHLTWLAEQKLVTTRTVGDDIMIAHITRRGDDVAAGRVRIPGVRRHVPQ